MLSTLPLPASDCLTTNFLFYRYLSFLLAFQVVEESLVWKKIFEEAANGKCPRGSLGWHGGFGILPCFATPNQRILDRVGYKRAAGLLFELLLFL